MAGTKHQDPSSMRTSGPAEPAVDQPASAGVNVAPNADRQDASAPNALGSQANLGAATSVTPSGSAARWWLAVGTGAIVSMPFAWLLSYAAMLPFYLGLFFFVLFGLVIGAVMHRVAAPGRPFGQATLVIGTTAVVASCWLVSIVKESRDFPHDMAVEAARTRYIGEQTVQEYRAAVADEVRRFLREGYPPGGTLGYTRWVITSGELEKGRLDGVSRTLRRSQCKLWWAVRVVLSIAFLGYGIGSQTLALRMTSDPAVRMIDEKKEADDP